MIPRVRGRDFRQGIHHAPTRRRIIERGRGIVKCRFQRILDCGNSMSIFPATERRNYNSSRRSARNAFPIPLFSIFGRFIVNGSRGRLPSTNIPPPSEYRPASAKPDLPQINATQYRMIYYLRADPDTRRHSLIYYLRADPDTRNFRVFHEWGGTLSSASEKAIMALLFPFQQSRLAKLSFHPPKTSVPHEPLWTLRTMSLP